MTVTLSLEYTFNDINRFFGNIDRRIPSLAKREVYRGVWKEMILHCEEENEGGLQVRLIWYKDFLSI